MDENEKTLREDRIRQHIEDMDIADDEDAIQEDIQLRLAALRAQERIETREEIAAYIYAYKGSTMSGGNGLLRQGDYMSLNNSGDRLTSSRGVDIALNTGDLERMIDAGVLDKALRADDLNSPDFRAHVDKMIEQTTRQAKYQDAQAYYSISDNTAVAAFVDDVRQVTPTAAIIRNGSEFTMATAEELKSDVTGIAKGTVSAVGDFAASPFEAISPERECSYEEFNPGGRDIKRELERHSNPERENQGIKREDMKAEITDTAAKKPSVAKTASVFDSLQAAAQPKPDHEALQNSDDEFSPLASSKAMRRIQ